MTNVQAMNAVPKHFWIMLMSVIVVGSWAGNTVVPAFLLTTPILAFVLFRAQVRETRERLFDAAHGLDRMPADVRARAQRALNELPDGEVRGLLVGILQVGGTARSNLPTEYANTDYGTTIDELVSAAVDTAMHAQSFHQTMRALEGRPATDFDLVDALEKVRDARDTRVTQLTTALRVLSEIGPDIAEAGDAGTRRIIEILDSLKREALEHDAAEIEIEQLLETNGVNLRRELTA
jgi:hypothetical protein